MPFVAMVTIMLYPPISI